MATHLSEEAILLLTAGDVTPESNSDIARHLESCAECRTRLEESFAFRSELRHALEERKSATFSAKLRQKRWPKQLFWAGTAATVAVAMFSWTLMPPKLDAEEVLTLAIQAEEHHAQSEPRLIQVRRGNTGCSWPLKQTGHTLAISTCANLKNSLAAVPWGWDKPLSAETFRAWHNKVAHKSDSLVRADRTFRIITRTASEPILLAELTVQSSDYHVVRLRLEVKAQPPIEISEELAGTVRQKPDEIVTAATLASVPTSHAMDIEEVNSWLVLERLNLLDGWTAALRRSGNRIEVAALVDSPARQKELATALSALPGASPLLDSMGSPNFPLDRLAPHREMPTAYPPLGERWLRGAYNGDSDELTNEVLLASQKVLGYASMRNLLLTRQSAMTECSCAAQLQPVIDHKRQELRQSTAHLFELLEPLFGPGSGEARRPPELNTVGAQELDASILHVFSSGPGNGATLEQERETICRILHLR